MGIGSGGQESRTPWIFKHDTDKVEGGLMVLFFVLIFSVAREQDSNCRSLGFHC